MAGEDEKACEQSCKYARDVCMPEAMCANGCLWLAYIESRTARTDEQRKAEEAMDDILADC